MSTITSCSTGTPASYSNVTFSNAISRWIGGILIFRFGASGERRASSGDAGAGVRVSIAPDGRASVVADDMHFPNGTVLTPGGRTLKKFLIDRKVPRDEREWGLDAATIGVVTDTGRTVDRHQGEIVADIPSRELADVNIGAVRRQRRHSDDALGGRAHEFRVGREARDGLAVAKTQ